MIYTGLNYRDFTNHRKASFSVANLSIDNLQGSGSFGFSGEGKIFKFDFIKGHINDPENRYIYSYIANTPFSLSGNLNELEYNYYIDNKHFCKLGSKEDFSIEKFFIDSSGCQILVDNITCAGPPIDHEINFSQGVFALGTAENESHFVGAITNNTYEDGTFKIYNAEVGRFAGGANSNLFDFVEYPPSISPLSTGDFVLKNIGGNAGEYNLELNFDTNIGTITEFHRITGISTSVLSSHGLETPSPVGGGESRAPWLQNGIIYEHVSTQHGVGHPWELAFTYTASYISGSHQTKPMNVELTYAQGNTGVYRTIAGIDLEWNGDRHLPGYGYKAPPVVIFESGEGNDIQTYAEVLSSGYHVGNYQRVRNVYITHGGSGYAGAPNVVFANGQPSDVTPTGTALVSGYGSPVSYKVTGVQIDHSGLYWDYTPSSVSFSGLFVVDASVLTGHAYGLAQYEPSGVTGYTVTGIKIDDPTHYIGGSGVYYSGSFPANRWGNEQDPSQDGDWFPNWDLSNWVQPAPAPYFSGEFYDLTGVTVAPASGTGVYETYSKEFNNNWDLYTGIEKLGNEHGDHFDSIYGYKYNNYVSGDISYFTESGATLAAEDSSVYVVVGHKLEIDKDPMSVILNVSGYGARYYGVEPTTEGADHWETAYITGYKSIEQE